MIQINQNCVKWCALAFCNWCGMLEAPQNVGLNSVGFLFEPDLGDPKRRLPIQNHALLLREEDRK